MFESLKKSNSQYDLKTSKRIGTTVKRPDKVISHPAFKVLVVFNILGALIAGYLYLNREEDIAGNALAETEMITRQTSPIITRQVRQMDPPLVEVAAKKKVVSQPPVTEEKSSIIPQEVKNADPVPTPIRTLETRRVEKQVEEPKAEKKNSQSRNITAPLNYTVAGPQVYFHSKPDERTRRNAFINRWNKAVLKPLDEANGFVYIEYTNAWGQTSKGWMLKKQLKALN